jgi:prevent-host-death family protein
MKITVSEFQRNVGRYQDEAQHAPVAISKEGRPHTVLVSAAYFELLKEGRVARFVDELDDDTLQAIADSKVPDEYAHLDRLIEDWKP